MLYLGKLLPMFQDGLYFLDLSRLDQDDRDGHVVVEELVDVDDLVLEMSSQGLPDKEV